MAEDKLKPGGFNISSEGVDVSYQQIDWNLDPEKIRSMTVEELQEHLVVVNEQLRRIHDAVEQMAKRLAGTVPQSDDVSVQVEVDMILNPDKPEYHKTPDAAQE